MSILPKCTYCFRFFSSDKGEFCPHENVGVCDDCNLINGTTDDEVTIIKRAVTAQFQVRQHKAITKRRRLCQPKPRLTPEEAEKARKTFKRLHGTRRERASYLAIFAVNTADLIDDVKIDPRELPTTYIGSEYFISFVGDSTPTTTFASAFCNARPQFCELFINLSFDEEDIEEERKDMAIISEGEELPQVLAGMSYVSQRNPPAGFHLETFAVTAE